MTKQIGDYKIEVSHDPLYDINPRDDQDNLSKMVCFHRRYDLGDIHDLCSSNYDGWDEMREAIERENNIISILPLYLYDHSGLSISTTPFNCKWDSGQVGFVYVTKERADEFGVSESDAERHILLEVKYYDHYLRGEFYRVSILDQEGDEVDGCSGFVTEEEAMKSAEIILTPIIKRQAQ